MSNRVCRKTKVETSPMVLRSRRTQRRLVEARLHDLPLRVKAAILPRRQFLHLAAGAAAVPAISRNASAQAYPTRPVRIVVGFAAGGVADIAARLMGQWLSERLGQPFVVENRAGAGGNIGTESAVKAPADGHTLLLADLSNAVNATLYDKLNFNFIRDIAPVAGIIRTPGVMEVNPSFPAKTVPEFIAYAKANPGKISMATAGSGSAPHVFGELFKIMAGVDMLHVPYRGATPAITDLLSEGQEILVQIAKEPIAKKGARITSHIALPGRFLVYMPTVEHVGVSRKIESDNERHRLRKLIQTIRAEEDIPSGGFIVRTMAESASEAELAQDIDYLRKLWENIKRRAAAAAAPSLLHQDLSLAQRVLRDFVTEQTDRILIDSRENFAMLEAFAQDYMQSVLKRIQHYGGERPLFTFSGTIKRMKKRV